jgi:hypothetical protein
MLRAQGGGAGGVSNFVQRFNVPMIHPTSGTAMTTSGVFTLAAALPNLPLSPALMYFPANQFFGGSAQGWWYVRMASTTTGTAFQNFFGSSIGTPTITLPVTPTPWAGTATGGAWTAPSGHVVFLGTTPLNFAALTNNSYYEVYASFSFAGATSRFCQWEFNAAIGAPIMTTTGTTSGCQSLAGFIPIRNDPSGFFSPGGAAISPVSQNSQFSSGFPTTATPLGTSLISPNSIALSTTTAQTVATDSMILEFAYIQQYL